jgi:hypothetical protein
VLVVRKSCDVKIVVPVETARLLCARADERWHQRSNLGDNPFRTTIQVWPPRHGTGIGIGSIGSFTISWGAPQPSQATIVKLEWDEEHGGTEDAIRLAVNSLVGWPIANDSARTRVAGRAASVPERRII